jgi:hypothetical protein
MNKEFKKKQILTLSSPEMKLESFSTTPPHPHNKKGHNHQSVQWDTPASSQQKKAGMSNSQIKTILLVVCDVRVEYVPPIFKINHFQAKLQERVQNKRRDSWNVFHLLNQDKAISVCQFLAEKPNTSNASFCDSLVRLGLITEAPNFGSCHLPSLYLGRRKSYLSIGELVNTLPNSLTCRVLKVSQLTFSQIKSSHAYVVKVIYNL